MVLKGRSTWKPTPRMETSTCPPRIMPNDSDESKHEAPGTRVTVSLPALTMSLVDRFGMSANRIGKNDRWRPE